MEMQFARLGARSGAPDRQGAMGFPLRCRLRGAGQGWGGYVVEIEVWVDQIDGGSGASTTRLDGQRCRHVIPQVGVEGCR